MPQIIEYQQIDFDKHINTLVNSTRGVAKDVTIIVSEIIHDVRCHGDDALIKYTQKFDFQHATIETIIIKQDDFNNAEEYLKDDLKDSLKLAKARIQDFHKCLLPEQLYYQDSIGVYLGMRYTPLDAVGVYIPGGTASYPSSVLMNIVPAQIAGVERIVAVVPAPNNEVHPLVLYALKLCGITEAYKIGGAQAIAALAYGTQTIKAVDKITGPGNIYVAESKKQVFGKVGIDAIAGPSEILVIADNDANPYHVAVDLLSQAEHDVLAQAILIATSKEFADQVIMHIDMLLQTLPRKEIAQKSWDDYGIIIIVETTSDACKIANQFAPEHLQLAVAEPELLLPFIKHAGAIFMGYHTPEAIGDYIAGPNHVLPTDRTCRFASGLSTIDFMKRTTLIQCDATSVQKIAPSAVKLARAESLEAHALSCQIRLSTEIET